MLTKCFRSGTGQFRCPFFKKLLQYFTCFNFPPPSIPLPPLCSIQLSSAAPPTPFCPTCLSLPLALYCSQAVQPSQARGKMQSSCKLNARFNVQFIQRIALLWHQLYALFYMYLYICSFLFSNVGLQFAAVLKRVCSFFLNPEIAMIEECMVDPIVN